ncbi:MAG: CapA family protein [Candidatus Peribacteria bacterium]|nr:CapA family protein [Candidatus Peribacteria bacterium]
MLADLTTMEKRNCDIKVIALHRGAEYKLSPNQRQRKLAHTLIDNGADVILGGHAHVPGEIERYRGKYIFYSLGNFIFDQDRGKRASGAEFDYIFDYALGRKTVPTYIAMLAGLRIEKFPTGVKILLDKIEMTTMTNGIHTPLDTQTFQALKEKLLVM